jgi:hypothetical protein
MARKGRVRDKLVESRIKNSNDRQKNGTYPVAVTGGAVKSVENNIESKESSNNLLEKASDNPKVKKVCQKFKLSLQSKLLKI